MRLVSVKAMRGVALCPLSLFLHCVVTPPKYEGRRRSGGGVSHFPSALCVSSCGSFFYGLYAQILYFYAVVV